MRLSHTIYTTHRVDLLIYEHLFIYLVTRFLYQTQKKLFTLLIVIKRVR